MVAVKHCFWRYQPIALLYLIASAIVLIYRFVVMKFKFFNLEPALAARAKKFD